MSFIFLVLFNSVITFVLLLLRSVPNILFFFFFFFFIVSAFCVFAKPSAAKDSSVSGQGHFCLFVVTCPKFPPHEVSSWAYGVKAFVLDFWPVGVDTEGVLVTGPVLVANLLSCLCLVFLCTKPIFARREDSEVESIADGGAGGRGWSEKEEIEGEDVVMPAKAEDEEELEEDDNDEESEDESENAAGDEDSRTVGDKLSGLMLRRLRGLRRNASAGASTFSEESTGTDVALVVDDVPIVPVRAC